jgi:geranylgeranyl diphosphate synthase type II
MKAAAHSKEQILIGQLEGSIQHILADATQPGCPARLAQAMRHAVFPGGARLRPRLCLAVALACEAPNPPSAMAAASSIELLHCASLVHDDLPCFDDANLRRGKPSVHRAYGERIAVLTGDALIVLAFQALASPNAVPSQYLGTLIRIVGQAVGMPAGIVAGQARECEPHVALAPYHLEKTGALFAAATMAGAASAGASHEQWRQLGEQLGLAYQVADDIRDVAGSAEELGKPIGQDQAHARPSAALELGLAGAIKRLDQLIDAATQAVPACPGANGLRTLIGIEAKRFLPEGLAQRAA